MGRHLQEDAPDRTNPDTLLDWFKKELAEEKVTLADRLDCPGSDQPRDLADRNEILMKTQTMQSIN